jgi:ribosomal protein S18 acetylase RimI-like enzyme
MTEIRLLKPGEDRVLGKVEEGVFDGPVRADFVSEVLKDPRHHLFVATHHGTVVGFASGVHYLHPDKPPKLWINEVGVALTHRRQGLGARLLRALMAHGRQLGCVEAWLLVDGENAAARGLDSSLRLEEPESGVVTYSVSMEEADTKP